MCSLSEGKKDSNKKNYANFAKTKERLKKEERRIKKIGTGRKLRKAFIMMVKLQKMKGLKD
jgi:hypothetical protein